MEYKLRAFFQAVIGLIGLVLIGLSLVAVAALTFALWANNPIWAIGFWAVLIGSLAAIWLLARFVDWVFPGK